MKALEKIKSARKVIGDKFVVKLSHGEHLTHAAYMGGTAFLPHEIVSHIAGIVFFFILANYALYGLGESEGE